jgi:hypothetical protein
MAEENKPEVGLEKPTLEIVDMKMDVILAELDAKTRLIEEQTTLIQQLRGQLKLSTDLHEAGLKADLRNWVIEHTEYSYEEVYKMDTAGLKRIKDVYSMIKVPSFVSSGDNGKIPEKSLNDLFEFGAE